MDSMSNMPKKIRLDIKFAVMGALSIIITAIAFVLIAVWQSGQYNKLAQNEVDALISADLDHITQGVYNLVQTENEAIQLQVNHNLNIARHILNYSGKLRLSNETVAWIALNQFTKESETIELPKMIIGETWLGQNGNLAAETPIIDEVTRLHRETATIFQRMNKNGDMLRVATNIETSENKRAIGTYIPAVNPDGTGNPVISAILKGETYHGRAYVVNDWYLTAYEPIMSETGQIVGMLNVGIKQKNVEDRVRQAILQTKVGKTGYVYVLGGTGNNRGRYIISNKGERDGENIWMSKDSDDRFVIQEIVNAAIRLNPKEMTTVRYRWQNPGELNPRWKIARLAYYKPWDWVIGTSVYEDELQAYSTLLSDGRLRMTHVMAIAGVVISALIGLFAAFISWTITRPIRDMTAVTEQIIAGDLNQEVKVVSSDEIGVLANTFNHMTNKLKRTLEGLRKSEEKYRGIFQNAIEGLFQSTFEGRFFSSNPALACILGYDSPEELIASITDIKQQLYVVPGERDVLVKTILKNDTTFGFEVQIYRKDKTKIWVSISARIVRDDTGNPAYIEGFISDITGRKHAEEALAESRNYLDEIINSVADPMCVKDREHRWVLVNNAFCSFLGHSREALLGKSEYDFFPKSEADVFWEMDELVFNIGKENINEESFTDAQGVQHTILTKKTLYSDKKGKKFIVAIMRDITEQRRAEEEKKRLETRLSQAQKMEAIGTLAGGIAHDFNNILSAIIGFSELVFEDISECGNEESARENIREVLKASERAKQLVRQILTFSRMTETKFLPISLRSIIKESMKMLRAVIPSTIEIKLETDVPGMIMSDPTQINQILMNLCTNAVHAMGETGGILKIKLEEIFLAEDKPIDSLELSPGSYLKLTISDTGHGIPPEILERIFEPYFTTKEQGRGTGLGLSVIHGIIKSHNGTITCHSLPQKGTTFEIYFPKLDAGQEKEESDGKKSLPMGKERILFIDDEPILANLAVRMLKNIGYSVVPESNSKEALEIFRKNPENFDVVITDMTMPGITGDRLAKEIIAIRNDIPVILCTGYNEHISEKKAKEIGIKEFILKPLSIRTLAESICKVLDKC